MAKKISLNPFKMILPYIGAFLGIVFGRTVCPIQVCGFPLQPTGDISFQAVLLGFLIGWTIQSFFRGSK